ncbi:sodium:alanine symporter family protein [Nocardia cyriacigeorgica]|uniref:alanine/glycine:cation symporter family protein n=1 Tax=Nocardia cyriacigeorgica TaxID=135487 RepID=UPI0018942B08|nr:sodium:alanine symporter family protein [Nocardia cyriacigeorgica]MBF6161742.1 sodium:alanine symporter family protein [Nocardia cyriacigeorgica]MBF6200540.1 sodium:alanine symporter family protein [Nocardia cyriacigeorgica]MBF6317256.1 sodium:alanine symporter family protein [Nocardia cyriacigeorgica]MBF6345241.1 sodium:alanine symporter family protein [Nocardia cyriacigeorgica]MBF6514234.1 sodium:alanine symporter family protein [Nocardia cyriacigeorgica]
MDTFLSEASDFIWGPWLLIPLLLLTGLYLTILLRGVQFHRFGLAFWLAFVKRRDPGAEGDISHYQALSTALAATVGVGNIAGVATAIALGGPGAVFWMWCTGLVGMATKYSEAFLGVRFRRTDAAGEQAGGPMHYLRQGIKGPFGVFLGGFFAVAGVLASFGIGNMTQANTVAANVESEWGLPTWATGVIITVLAGAVILGGIKSIGRVTSLFVPFMIIVYILGATAVLAFNIDEVPSAIGLIVTDAFTGTAATGGFVGAGVAAAIRYGVARGIFSNESGLGTGGIAAAAAQTTHPVRQALVSMTQTFIDTLVVVSFTALTIVVTGVWKGEGSPATFTAEAFSAGLPGEWGSVIVTLGVILFAFSTVLGWSYYGDRCVEYLFGRALVLPYRIVFIAVVYIGATRELTTVWTFSDVANGLMALPNLIGLLILSPLVYRETKAYFDGKRPEDEKQPVASE